MPQAEWLSLESQDDNVIETTEFGGLFCEVNCPLYLSPVEARVVISPSIDLANQNCLRIILGLDEVVHEHVDESLEISHDLQRLDFKVNVILELVAQLISQNIELPPSVDLKLGSHALQWISSEMPTQLGQLLEVKLYLDPRFSFPLTLSGQVVDLRKVGNAHQIQLELDPPTLQTQELLEKYIFRCHRRHIARIKTDKDNN